MSDKPVNAISVFFIFLRLGLTSFGGPIAHLAYFRVEFVEQRRWFTEKAYADLVALCQFLPGPASSQVGLAIGLSKAGYAGAFAAWLGFTIPSALILILFALGLTSDNELQLSGTIQGLKIVAVAVIAQAIWGMARSLCPDNSRITLMLLIASSILLFPGVTTQIGGIVLAAIVGVLLFEPEKVQPDRTLRFNVNKSQGAIWLGLFVSLLIGLPLVASFTQDPIVTLVDSFYRSGALVFGGGHVVLPLLQSEVVPNGLVSEDTFLAGYGAAQAVPGPLFTFAAFLGAVVNQGPSGWLGGAVALLAIFLPSFLLIAGALPFWQTLKQNSTMRSALVGINAAVVGLLLATFFQPVWLSAIHGPKDMVMALTGFIALMFWKIPPWLVVFCMAAAGWLFF